MKINENTAISTPQVLLVPYEPRHVAQYHTWMADPAIQAATASEPLTLEEEYANQSSWRTSPDKLTFIVCQPISPLSSPHITAGECDSDAQMIGDVNFFLYPCEEEELQGFYEGEVDIMIASPAYRKRGFGREAVRALLWYVANHTRGITEEFCTETEEGGKGMEGVMVKIQEGNEGSMRLFGSLGFERMGGVSYFGEVKMVLGREKLLGGFLGDVVEGFREVEYRR